MGERPPVQAPRCFCASWGGGLSPVWGRGLPSRRARLASPLSRSCCFSRLLTTWCARVLGRRPLARVGEGPPVQALGACPARGGGLSPAWVRGLPSGRSRLACLVSVGPSMLAARARARGDWPSAPPAFFYARLNQATPRRLAIPLPFRRAGAVAPRRGQRTCQHSLVGMVGMAAEVRPSVIPQAREEHLGRTSVCWRLVCRTVLTYDVAAWTS